MHGNNNNGPTELIKHLWYSKFFIEQRSLDAVRKGLSELECNPTIHSLSMALNRSLFLSKTGKRTNYLYVQKYSAKKVIFSNEVFPAELIKDLGKEFTTEINDLKHNFGYSGTCTAFLLRKILEKLIFLTFSRNGLASQLKDNNGEIISLSKMIGLCTSNTIKGLPFLMPKTAKAIEGIKFLGDSSAHNPLITNVKMETIIHAMPFIITAYEELVKKL